MRDEPVVDAVEADDGDDVHRGALRRALTEIELILDRDGTTINATVHDALRAVRDGLHSALHQPRGS